MKFFNRAFFFLLIFIISCSPNVNEVSSPTKAKNIIFLIGDGMGIAQLSAVYFYSDQPSNFSRFKYIGLHQNQPVGMKITDSAAGATAFSTGYKSYNAAIGVDKDTIPRETILEWAAENSKLTGIIATSSITHATPASFYAHVANRNSQEEIAESFVENPMDFAAGGGLDFFEKREDGQNLIKALEAKGVVVETENLQEEHLPNNKYTYLLGADSLHSKVGGRGDFLPKSTDLAIDFLSKDKDGFFLMVEGSQIDWGGHSNKATFLIEEVKDFDLAVGKALDFAKKDGNTLVVVTADHETGGFALSAAQAFGQSNYGGIQPTFSTGGHTASLIPVFAYGPGAEQFIGIYENNELFKKMMDSFK
ncbi:MAG: alkaline phosphatase [Granulosicoccus sp.]|jgi:alkaline phosphatase